MEKCGSYICFSEDELLPPEADPSNEEEVAVVEAHRELEAIRGDSPARPDLSETEEDYW